MWKRQRNTKTETQKREWVKEDPDDKHKRFIHGKFENISTGTITEEIMQEIPVHMNNAKVRLLEDDHEVANDSD